MSTRTLASSSRRRSLAVLVLALAFLAAPPSASPVAAQAAGALPGLSVPVAGDVPYRLALEPFTIPGLPGLHSFAVAGDAGKVVLLAGRTNGLHGFAPSREAAQFPSFPKELANDTVYVVDLASRKLLGQAKVTGLPSPYPNQLQASNTQYLLEGGFLYVAGGYGPDPATGTMVTLPFVTAIDFDALVAAVTAGKPLDADFAKASMARFEHPALAVTGGDLEVQGGSVLLIYGHRFDGEYSAGGGQAFQEYTNSVRVFTVAATRGASGVSLQVSFQGSVPQVASGLSPDNPYHRRDLNVRPTLDPTGTPRIGVYGGVFKGGRMEGYVHPIYITPGSTLGLAVQEDTTATQLLSQYDCAVVQLYSQSRGATYSTFYGGLSQYYWDASCSCLKRDPVDVFGKGIDGLPFIASVSTFRVTAAGSAQFLHQGESFPPAAGAPACPSQGTGGGTVTAQFLGSESKFVPVAGLPSSNGVLLLDQLHGKTVVGYLVGGIAAWCPPEGANAARCYASTQGTSCASNQIYQVTLDPGTATPTVPLVPPAPAATGG